MADRKHKPGTNRAFTDADLMSSGPPKPGGIRPPFGDRTQEARERAENGPYAEHPDMATDEERVRGLLLFLADRVSTLETALRCSHPEEEWSYIEHQGETWNYCPRCGYAELWADCTCFKQDVLALAEGDNRP